MWLNLTLMPFTMSQNLVDCFFPSACVNTGVNQTEQLAEVKAPPPLPSSCLSSYSADGAQTEAHTHSSCRVCCLEKYFLTLRQRQQLGKLNSTTIWEIRELNMINVNSFALYHLK